MSIPSFTPAPTGPWFPAPWLERPGYAGAQVVHLPTQLLVCTRCGAVTLPGLPADAHDDWHNHGARP